MNKIVEYEVIKQVTGYVVHKKECCAWCNNSSFIQIAIFVIKENAEEYVLWCQTGDGWKRKQ